MLIEKLDNYGRGITYIDGKITFVKDALPGEEVEVEITNSKKKFNEGIVKNYIKKSSDRLEPVCLYYNICGGCDLSHMSYENQLKFKLDKVNSIIKKYGDIDITIDKIESTKQLNYRNKATFQVKHNVGYFKEKTNEIVSIDKCLLVDDRINEVLEKVKKINLDNIYQIVVRCSKDDTLVIFKTNGYIDVSNLDVPNIVAYNKGYYKTLKGKGYIIEDLGDLKYIVSPDSFFQVNTEGALKLYNKVKEFAEAKKTDKVLDLFCGTGTIGLFLSRDVESVFGIEINKYAVEDAIKNKKLNKIDNIDFICDDASNVNLTDIDTVIVDPPRSGLNEKIVNYLKNMKSKKIVYVSCDPITLARDLKMLKDCYDVKKIELVDMFPNTYHVECVSVLHRKTQ